MVMRSHSADSANRAQTHASRATLRELDSKPFWSESKELDVMDSETHTGVEFAENYGATSVPAKQDQDDQQQQGQQGQQDSGGGGPGGAGAGSQGEEGQQPQGDAAEAIVLYLNGSRSHPVIISMGDRRHRLFGLEEGDYANHRLKDDRQQFLLSKDGTYLSTRNDKVMRIALVEPKDTGQPKPSQQQQSSAPTATQTAANGGGSSSSTGQQGQGKQQKKYGQASAKDDNKSSKISFQQDGKATTIQHEDGKSQQTKDDSTAYHGDKTKSVQATTDHAHLRTGGNRVFTDKGGCWSTTPMLVKKDGHCKE